ncbi:replication factor A protein 3 [Trichodelitschia bisporula]|uniref:Replication factor A protein 3 n=1 Tax=Trichodelitschia bisporula TaxID=703511 RepID=A0A6G1HP45_9PEZI|nr:replication factor A protein 3 [Trichodelitschia bisporula]
MPGATPRVTQQYLENFRDRVVRIVGKVTKLNGDTAIIDANGTVKITLNREANLAVGHAAEIVGRVQPDLSILMLGSTDFGTDFNLNAAAAVVEATHRWKEIFYGDD